MQNLSSCNYVVVTIESDRTPSFVRFSQNEDFDSGRLPKVPFAKPMLVADIDIPVNFCPAWVI